MRAVVPTPVRTQDVSLVPMIDCRYRRVKTPADPKSFTMIPSMIVIFLGLDPTLTLVFSQVLLSFGLPFAVIPLVMFTSRRDLMGVLTNSRLTNILASAIAVIIVVLNLYLIYQTLFGG